MPERSVTTPRSARIQPFSETTTVIGSRSTSASSMAASSCSGACAKLVRRLPSGVFGPNFARISLISPATFFHCSLSEPMRCLSVVRSARRSLSSFLISISSSLRRLRSRMLRNGVGLHVGELEGLHQDGLRLVPATDDLDHLVEVEVGDEIAAEHLKPVLDLV